MAWTTPGTAVAGAVLEADFWNSNVRDNLLEIRNPQINVKSTTRTATTPDFSVATTATSGDIDGLTVSITPTSAASKVLVHVSLTIAAGAARTTYFGLFRNGTIAAQGDANGSAKRLSFADNVQTSAQTVSMTFLDAPASTSALTYSIRVAHNSGSTTTYYVNRDSVFAATNLYSSFVSTITATEIPA